MFKSLKNLILIVIVLIGLGFAVNFVLANGIDVGLEYGENTGLSDTDPREVVANIIRIALAFLGILAVAIIMYGGFVWMTAGGDDQKIDTAKKILVSATIGLVIILSAFAIATFVLNRILDATSSGNGNSNNSNGNITPPGSVISCDGNSLTPQCDADDSFCGDGYYCNSASSSCSCAIGGGLDDPCDGDIITATCDADNSLCGSNYYCDSDLCICKSVSGLYEACNATSTQGVCEPNQSICSFDLTCDASDCFCKDFPIIKEISPSGGFCDDEPNKKCSNDDDCSLTPNSTCNISTPNAAPGNIITILGNYFGTTTGVVLFWDGSDFTIPGLSPSAINANCDSNWTNDQIIIIVPNGAVAGPVLIRRTDGEEDTTDNDKGPLVADLLINNITKPGLCKIAPAEGVLGDSVSYYGINFTPAGGDVKFGSYDSFVAGKNTSFLNDNSSSSVVPNINSGKTTSFVTDNQDNESNFLRFKKLVEESPGAFIVDFTPKSGASGQYVTIRGSGFKNTKGSSRVYFGDEQTGIEASYDFPDVCADSVWSDNQIIIKVPDNNLINDDNFIITIVIDGKTIDTSGISPDKFNVDNGLLLAPSLCKISPSMGQAGDSVSLWGEYFDKLNANSIVRFYLNKDVKQADISLWDIDPNDQSELDVYKINTLVPNQAVTGPVVVIKGSPPIIGNSLDFEVGNCLEAVNPDDACGAGNVCCPADTFKAGKCDTSINTCNDTGIPNSVYEWDFSTSPSVFIPETPFSSCAEKSEILGLCDIDICPNSAGSCSFFDSLISDSARVKGDCSYSCQIEGCLSGNCSYDSSLDRCLDNNQNTCSLSVIVQDISGKDIPASCESYKGEGKRILRTSSSCPDNWTRTLNKGESVCVDEASTCVLCQDSFTCIDDKDFDLEGVCAITKDICPNDSICESDNKCRSLEKNTCDCCCRLAFEDQDCCADLTCAGECGSDKNVDTNTYGVCSGCRIESSPGVVNYTASDQACNCFTASGKYCDVNVDVDGDGVAEGACQDCGQLASDDSCSAHSSTCCVDAKYNSKCRGGKGDFSILNNGVGYCQYFQCQDNNTSCNASPVAKPADSVLSFDNLADCQSQCAPAPILGLSCSSKEDFTCALSSCPSPFGCITKDGQNVSNPNAADCGTCCCDPNATIDACSNINTKLSCQKDQSPCSGGDRGLCCGCDNNISCGKIDERGCGNDTCCHARPGVKDTAPFDGATKICSNSEIRVTFDQKMNAKSFSSNVIVIGEYDDICPEGTDYLAFNGEGFQDKNIIVRTFYKLTNKLKTPVMKLLGRNALASSAPQTSKNYCAVRGFVDSQQNGENSTILKFSPINLFDTNTKYFVVIKGDVALNNGTGVLNFWDIGMNIEPAEGPVNNTSAFNGIVYNNSYIWSFTTLEAQEDNPKGLCEIDHVDIAPTSYLFNTIINDLNENDTDIDNKTFDTVADKDKRFISYAISADGQVLAPVNGYSWNWNWNVVDSNVVSIVPAIFPLGGNSKLVQANDGVVDKLTKLKAEIELIDFSYSDIGDGKIGAADIQVFICENPWPGINVEDGTWFPWLDKNNNCIPDTGTCLDTNYLLYYCRDRGEVGTQDDLPAIFSEAITRGANSEILKESFFFREEAPSIQGVLLTGEAAVEGKAAIFDWKEIIDPTGNEKVKSYKIYYNTDQGSAFTDDVTILATEAPYVSGKSKFRLEGLENNTNYYFAITAVYGNDAESDYSNEVYLRIADKKAPSSPTSISAKVSDDQSSVIVSWEGVDPDTVGYRVYYGHTAGNPGFYIPENKNELITIKTASLKIAKDQNKYFIFVTAVDEYGNESNRSQEITITF